MGRSASDLGPGPRHSRALRRAGVLTRRWCGKGGADTTPLVIMTVPTPTRSPGARAVSACSSSPILDVVDQFGLLPANPNTVPVDLLDALAAVPDPRARRGVRHRLVTVLAIGVCAVLAGACTFTAITEWAQDLPVGVRVRLGLGRVAPCESTIRRILQAVDPDALDAAVSAWLAPRSVAWPPTRRMIAIDGKTARGARGPDGRAVRLLAAFDQISGVVLGQSAVDGKTNEINAFTPLLPGSTLPTRSSPPTRSTPNTATPTTFSAVARITC